MKICIVEDERIVAYDLAEIISGYGFPNIELKHTLKKATETLSDPADAYILDIRLADGNGILLGEKLSELQIPFIYITANNEVDIIKQAVRSNPVAYISKPFKEREIFAAIELLKSKKENKIIEIMTSKGMVEVSTNSILFCKSNNVYVEVVTTEKVYLHRTTLKEFYQQLTDNFIRVHRSYVVNKSRITSKKPDRLFVNQIEIPVSRRYRDQI